MDKNLFTFIYRITAGHRIRMIIASFISGSSRGMILATINTAAASAILPESLVYHGLQFVFFVSVFVYSNYYVRVNSSRLVGKAQQRMTLNTCKKLMLAELAFIESYRSSELYQKLRMDIILICSTADTLLGSVQALILLVFCLAYIAWLVPVAVFITIIAIIIGVVIYSIQNNKIKETIRLSREAQVDYGEGLSSLAAGFKELKLSLNKRRHYQNDLKQVTEKYIDLNIKVTRLETITYLTTQLFMYVLVAIVILVLPIMLELDKDSMFQFFAVVLFLIGPLESLVSSYQKITQANISYDKFSELNQAIDEHTSELVFTEENKSSMNFNVIELDNVCFEYKSKKTDDTFKSGPISLTINRGEILFIVGGNGTGKTTLLKLLSGLYVPDSGCIKVDDEKLELQYQQDYRELFTTIFSNFYIFKKIYGHDGDIGDRYDKLLKDLKLHEKTKIVDNKFSTSDLSQGQRKRLAYVISLIDDRDIYVFDEFAADQDPKFKKYFYFTILPELKRLGKTVIAVTHDDNYFDACDRLIKMDNGQLIEFDKELANHREQQEVEN